MTGLEIFAGRKYLNLETFRRSGQGVRTPVWFAAATAEPELPKLYVYTTADSEKAKRIRRTGAVRIAPCDARGRVTGSWIEAQAALVAGEDYDCGMRLLDRKYWPWKQMLDVSFRMFPRHQRVMIVIRAA